MQGRIKKKLIEVAFPLDAINTASAREKCPLNTLHSWWARQPLTKSRKEEDHG